jgi:nucleotide-binding universal stress UspA family protein
MTEEGTSRRIIVGYDGSKQADDALALGKLIADASDAELVVAGVFRYDPLLGPTPAFQEAEADYAREVERAAESVSAEAEAIPSTSPARGLHELAEEIDADLIVVGSAHHGRLGQVLAGSVGMSLLHGSPCAVAVAPRGYSGRGDRRLTEVVVGFDGSPEARVALAGGVELARASGAPLKLVAVAEPPVVSYGKGGGMSQAWYELKDAIEKIMRERLTKAVESLPDEMPVESALVSGEPASVLAEIATAEGGLLLLGSRAYGPLRRVLLGSVSAALVRSAPGPLVVHPRPLKEERRSTEPAEAGRAPSGP